MTVILTRMWAACATDRVHDTVKVDAALDERHADGSTERVPLSASSDVTVEAGWTAIEHTSKTDGAEKKPANRILPREGTSLPVRLTFPRRGRVRTAETVHGSYML